MILFRAQFQLKPGQFAAYQDHFQKRHDALRESLDGFEDDVVFVDPANSDRVSVLSSFSDETALTAYQQSPVMAEYMTNIRPLIAAIEIANLYEVSSVKSTVPPAN